jgi:hypothetical protein
MFKRLLFVLIAAAYDLRFRRSPQLGWSRSEFARDSPSTDSCSDSASVGSMTGASNWFAVFLMTAIVVGIIAAGVLLFREGLRRTVLNVLRVLGALIRFRAPYRERPELDVADSSAVTLPHGFAIAAGPLLFIVLSRNMH